MHALTSSKLILPASLILVLSLASCAQTGDMRTGERQSGSAARGEAPTAAGWRADAPGVRHRLGASGLPAPVTSQDPEGSVARLAKVVAPPQGALPKVPDGFAVQVFARGFDQPRTLRVAPNGDVFLSESGAGRVLVFRSSAGGAPAQPEVFATNLQQPYGIAFHPPAEPRYVYVAAANQVVRYPYRSGDTQASGPAQVIIDNIPTKRHWTRDLAVSRDGSRLFLAVGSASNLGVGGMPDMAPEQIRRHEATHGRGAAWGEEEDRAVVRVFDPEGKTVRNFATGLRNCSGLAMQPGTDNLWCVVNERDHLGPDVAPDHLQGHAAVRVHEASSPHGC